MILTKPEQEEVMNDEQVFAELEALAEEKGWGHYMSMYGHYSHCMTVRSGFKTVTAVGRDDGKMYVFCSGVDAYINNENVAKSVKELMESDQ